MTSFIGMLLTFLNIRMQCVESPCVWLRESRPRGSGPRSGMLSPRSRLAIPQVCTGANVHAAVPSQHTLRFTAGYYTFPPPKDVRRNKSGFIR